MNPFVPKPGTPYQWLPMEDPKETDRKLQFLRKAFGRMANVDAVIKSARTGVSQSILALADRRVADALEHACVENVDLKRAMKAVGLDPGFYLFRGRGREEILPWDIVDNGVSKAYYLRELDKSAQEKISPHCPEIQGCIRCGVCVETPNPSYRLPGEMEGARHLARGTSRWPLREGSRGPMIFFMLAACLAWPPAAARSTSPSDDTVPARPRVHAARWGSRRSWTTRVCASRWPRACEDSRCPVDVQCVWEGDAPSPSRSIDPPPPRATTSSTPPGAFAREVDARGLPRAPSCGSIPRRAARPRVSPSDYRATLPRRALALAALSLTGAAPRH